MGLQDYHANRNADVERLNRLHLDADAKAATLRLRFSKITRLYLRFLARKRALALVDKWSLPAAILIGVVAGASIGFVI